MQASLFIISSDLPNLNVAGYAAQSDVILSGTQDQNRFLNLTASK